MNKTTHKVLMGIAVFTIVVGLFSLLTHGDRFTSLSCIFIGAGLIVSLYYEKGKGYEE